MLRWRGSLWQLIWPEMLIWWTVYACIAVIYRLALNADQRRLCPVHTIHPPTLYFTSTRSVCSVFETLAVFCEHWIGVIPLTFILGFYVSFVIGRWWNWFLALPWPDRAALYLAVYFGQFNGEFTEVIFYTAP
jgi:hypothetical protein